MLGYRFNMERFLPLVQPQAKGFSSAYGDQDYCLGGDPASLLLLWYDEQLCVLWIIIQVFASRIVVSRVRM
jgi:hypothetical protein